MVARLAGHASLTRWLFSGSGVPSQIAMAGLVPDHFPNGWRKPLSQLYLIRSDKTLGHLNCFESKKRRLFVQQVPSAFERPSSTTYQDVNQPYQHPGSSHGALDVGILHPSPNLSPALANATSDRPWRATNFCRIQYGLFFQCNQGIKRILHDKI